MPQAIINSTIFNYCYQVCAFFSNLDTANLTILVVLAMLTNTQYYSVSNKHDTKAPGFPSNFAGRSNLIVLAVNIG